MKRVKFIKSLAIPLLLLFTGGSVSAEMTLVRGVVSSGGQVCTDGSVTIKSTTGNFASYNEGITWPRVQTGYWNLFMQTTGCDCTPGDANANGDINILDIIYLIDYKFKQGPAPMPFAICSGDADCNCTVNILDIILLIEYKFKDGLDPCDCMGWNGSCGIL